MSEKEYLYWLCHIPGLGAVSIRRLYEYFGSFRAIWNAGKNEIAACKVLKAQQQEAFLENRKKTDDLQREYDCLAARGIRFLAMTDQEYPQRLRPFHDSPAGLFVKGRLPEEERPSVAIVGARGCTEYGRQLARVFARGLAEEGVQIISGLALGIDGAAHDGSLEFSNCSFAVLGCGVDICYPRENYPLFSRIQESGGLISEFLPGSSPQAMNFPMRNRVISAFSDVVIVIEAREKSGSLITADLALEQGKEVFAIPGRLTDPLSAGCNRLIQSGAQAALTPADVLEYLGVQYEKKITISKKNENRLAKREKLVYSCLDLRPKHLEEIMELCGLGITECMECILELELAGLLYRVGNQYFCKRL